MKRITSVLLTIAMLLSVIAMPAQAASNEVFLSEVSLIYEDSIEAAKAAIAGTDWKLFEQDLNAKADYMFDDGVYLIYKTSNNVEDAITDLRVMDMYGGFSISSYEKQLEASRAQYIAKIKELRKVTAEFKALYEAGDAMAKLAYRQMNYYKDVKTTDGTETDLLMGDFFLNMPNDDKVVQVLLEGNTLIVSNLISLLAVGISGEDENTLATTVAQMYEVRDTLTDLAYYDDAVALTTALAAIRAKLLRYDALSEEYDLDDEDISDEELVFITEYATIALLLKEIKLGQTNLADLLRSGTYTAKDFYPIVAAFSEGQKALIKMGQIETILKYNAPSKPVAELNKVLDDMEAQLKDENGVFTPYDVYLGVDRSIFKGAFAFTTAAERQQALNGDTWDLNDAATRTGDQMVGYIVAASVDAGLIALMIGGGITQAVLNRLASSAYATWRASTVSSDYIFLMTKYQSAKATAAEFGKFMTSTMEVLPYYTLALALVILGSYGISTWYNYYNPDYTEIPNTMIDIRETTLGDRYVKYTAAKVFGEKDKNADFNAYQGKEWIALYYTKDATAGSCLTPNFVFKTNDATIARRHQGIAMFGETKAFNLNSHVYSSDAQGAYVTVRYSNTKKSAADIPTVVGSMFAGAMYLVTALVGATAGVGATLWLQKAKKKSSSPETAK